MNMRNLPIFAAAILSTMLPGAVSAQTDAAAPAAPAEDAQVADTPSGFRGSALALNVASEGDVDAYFQQALAAGGQKIKQPEKVFWGGYSGYFADLDGHLWEVAHNPFFQGDSKTGQLKLEGVQP